MTEKTFGPWTEFFGRAHEKHFRRAAFVASAALAFDGAFSPLRPAHAQWASYDSARPGTLRLVPNEARIKDLRANYRDMAPMMFDRSPPLFDDILAKIATIQEIINA